VDFIAGFTIFSLITLGALWYFAYGWTRLTGEYAAAGLSFGTLAQFNAAVGVMVVTPMLGVLVVYLARSAIRLPRAVWRAGMKTPAPRVAGIGPVPSSQ